MGYGQREHRQGRDRADDAPALRHRLFPLRFRARHRTGGEARRTVALFVAARVFHARRVRCRRFRAALHHALFQRDGPPVEEAHHRARARLSRIVVGWRGVDRPARVPSQLRPAAFDPASHRLALRVPQHVRRRRRVDRRIGRRARSEGRGSSARKTSPRSSASRSKARAASSCRRRAGSKRCATRAASSTSSSSPTKSLPPSGAPVPSSRAKAEGVEPDSDDGRQGADRRLRADGRRADVRRGLPGHRRRRATPRPRSATGTRIRRTR